MICKVSCDNVVYQKWAWCGHRIMICHNAITKDYILSRQNAQPKHHQRYQRRPFTHKDILYEEMWLGTVWCAAPRTPSTSGLRLKNPSMIFLLKMLHPVIFIVNYLGALWRPTWYPKMVISRAPSRFPERELDRIPGNVQLRVPLTQKDSTNIKVMNFKRSGVVFLCI